MGLVGEVLFHIVHKGGAAGGGQHSLLLQLTGLGLGGHVGAQGHLHHVVEAQHLQAGNHLAQVGGGELTGDGGRHSGVNVEAPLLCALEHLNGVHDKGLVHNGTEGALIDTGAAGGALGGIDKGLLVLAHGDGARLAAPLTGAGLLFNGAVGAGVDTLAAGDALLVVDLGLVVHNGDGVLGAGMDTAGGDTATAGGAHGDLGDGALVAGDIQHLHQVGVGLVAAHGHLHTLRDDGPLLINTTAHFGLGTGDDLLGNIQNTGLEIVVPGQPGHGTQHLMLEFLYAGFKYAHWSTLLPIIIPLPISLTA